MNVPSTEDIPPPELIQHSSETVIYLGYFFPVWGHVITDNIRRAWFLNSEYFNEFKNCPLAYVAWNNQKIESQQNFRRLLEILGVDVDRVKAIEQPTQFDKIILPDSSFAEGFNVEYRETIDRVREFALKNRTPTSSKKIYYFHGRRQIGEERLAEYFKSKGYEIISPEKLTLDEQLNLLINAESFASTLGSCAHNSVFLRDNTEAIFIPRTHINRLLGWQPKLDQVHPLNANYIDSSLSIFFTYKRNGPSCYIVSEQLKRFFGEKFDGYEEEDFKNFLQYVKDSVSKGIEPEQNFKEYYDTTVLPDFMSQLKQRKDLITAADMPPNWDTFQPSPTYQSSLTYQTHVHKRGWRDGWKGENQISNPLDQSFDIQAIKINFPSRKVYYSVYFNDKEGWSEEVSDGEQAGTTGKSKPIYGIKIRLDEAGEKEFDILYRVHKFDGNWTLWAKNGEALYSGGVKLNAIQIKLEPKT